MGLFNNEIECDNCGKKIPQKSKFCPYCGEPASMTKKKIVCPNCNEKIPVDSRFCPHCAIEIDAKQVVKDKVSLDQKDKPEIWNRTPEIFAKKIVLSHKSKILTTGLIVEPGTKAIILSNGEIKNDIQAGKYSLDKNGILYWIKKLFYNPITGKELPEILALLVDTEDTFLHFGKNHRDDIVKSKPNGNYQKEVEIVGTTLDGVSLNLVGDLSIIVSNPMNFITRVMKGASEFEKRDVKDFIKPILTDCTKTFVQQIDYSKLSADQSTKDKFRSHITQELQTRLSRYGLSLIGLENFSLLNEAMEKVVTLKGGNRIIESLNEEILTSKKIDNAFTRNLDEIDTEDLEKRQSVYERFLNASNLRLFTELDSKEEYDKFKNEIDKDNLIRQSEWDSLVREIQAKADQEDSAIEHARNLINMKREFELGQLNRRNKREEVRDNIETNKIEDEYSRETLLKDTETEENVKDIQSQGQIGRESKQFELEKEKQKTEIELERLQDINKNKSRDERLKSALEAKQKLHEMKMQRKGAEYDHELKMHDSDNEVKITEITANKEVGLAKAGSDEEHSKELLNQHKEYSKKMEDYFVRSQENSQETLDKFIKLSENAFNSMNKNSSEREELINDRVKKAEEYKKDTVDKVTEIAGVRADGKTMICPSCKQEVLSTYRVCNHCGHQFYK